MTRMFRLTALAVSALLVLTACNPPLPDSLRVSITERTVQCGDSLVDIDVLPEMLDVADFWGSSMDTACEGSMGLSILEEDLAGSGLVVSEEGSPKCEAFATVPVAADAAVISFFFDEIYELNLTPEAIVGIFSGTITNWSDPEVVDANPNVELPNLEIVVKPGVTEGAIQALEAWMSYLTETEVDLTLLEPAQVDELEALFELQAGEIKVTTYSALQVSGMSYANLLLNRDGVETVLLPDVLALNTGVGQTVISGEGSALSFEYDPTIPPAPLPGQFEAIEPWGGLFPVYMHLCGEENLDVRYAGRFLLRQDAQGSISTGVMTPLNEEIRVAAIGVVAEGLPEVEIPEELLEELEG